MSGGAQALVDKWQGEEASLMRQRDALDQSLKGVTDRLTAVRAKLGAIKEFSEAAAQERAAMEGETDVPKPD